SIIASACTDGNALVITALLMRPRVCPLLSQPSQRKRYAPPARCLLVAPHPMLGFLFALSSMPIRDPFDFAKPNLFNLADDPIELPPSEPAPAPCGTEVGPVQYMSCARLAARGGGMPYSTSNRSMYSRRLRSTSLRACAASALLSAQVRMRTSNTPSCPNARRKS